MTPRFTINVYSSKVTSGTASSSNCNHFKHTCKQLHTTLMDFSVSRAEDRIRSVGVRGQP